MQSQPSFRVLLHIRSDEEEPRRVGRLLQGLRDLEALFLQPMPKVKGPHQALPRDGLNTHLDSQLLLH